MVVNIASNDCWVQVFLCSLSPEPLLSTICLVVSRRADEIELEHSSAAASEMYLRVPFSVTNKIERYTIFFIVVEALHVGCR